MSRAASLLALASIVALPATRAQEPDLDALPMLRLVEEARIASDAHAQFRPGVAIDRDGQIYVLEQNDHQIHVYAPDGRLVRKIGHLGVGQGWFDERALYGVVGDTIWVLESARENTRLWLLTRAGSPLGPSRQIPGVRIPLEDGFSGVIRPTMMSADGTLVGEMNMLSAPLISSGVSSAAAVRTSRDTTPTRTPRVLWDASGNQLPTPGWDLRPQDASLRAIAIEDRPRHALPRPTPDNPMTITIPDGRILVDRERPTSAASSTMRVTRITMAGDTVFSRSYRYQPVRYSAALLDTLAARSAAVPGGAYRIVNGQPVPPAPFQDVAAARAVIRANMDFPEFQTPVQSYSIGADRSIWLRRENDATSSARWILLDPAGTPRGRLEIPNRLYVARSSGDMVWAYDSDAAGNMRITRFRIQPD